MLHPCSTDLSQLHFSSLSFWTRKLASIFSAQPNHRKVLSSHFVVTSVLKNKPASILNFPKWGVRKSARRLRASRSGKPSTFRHLVCARSGLSQNAPRGYCFRVASNPSQGLAGHERIPTTS